MCKLIDMTGEKFCRLTVIERDGNCGKHVMWKCICDCGTIVTVRGTSLRSGNTKSCGCLKSETYKKTDHSHIKHMETGTRLYRIWMSMKNRCYYKKHKYYRLYGGRGISVCDEWKNDYVTFRNWSIDNGYNEKMSIDRIDNDKGYEPNNCRYIYYKDQPKNRRTNHIVIADGEKMTVSECSKKYGIPISTIVFRDNHGRNVLERLREW